MRPLTLWIGEDAIQLPMINIDKALQSQSNELIENFYAKRDMEKRLISY